MPIFRLEMLPAADGDCLLLSWGDGALSHLVVDGGRAGSYPYLKARLAQIAAAGERVELFVLTHIDADHIEGALAYLRDGARPIAPAQIWYNGRVETSLFRTRSMRQGDAYSAALSALRWPLNASYTDGVARIGSAPVPIDVAGIAVTMLSPDQVHLDALGRRWDQWHAQQGVRVRGLATRPVRRPLPPEPLIVEDLSAPTPTDAEPPNGSSIAFVAEWRGRRILFGGDAHPDVLAQSLRPLAEAEGGRYRVDLLKASHHGSAKNTTRELIELLDCRRMAISTSGAKHGHPDPQSIARFIRYGPDGEKHLYFNYASGWTRPWAAADVAERYGVRAHLPPGDDGTNTVDVWEMGTT